MASIYRKPYIDQRTGKRKFRSKWYIAYVDPLGQRHIVPGYTDKRATEQKAAELERQAVRRHVGLADPFEEHRGRPLAEHLEDYRRHLESKDNTAAYVRQAVNRVRRILDGCALATLADLESPNAPGKVAGWLADRRREHVHLDYKASRRRGGMGPQTSNDYRTNLRGFCTWLFDAGRMAANPMAGRRLVKVEVKAADVQRRRRVLTPADLARLIAAAAASSRIVRGLGGPDRAMVYLLASNTGFRAEEAAAVTPGSFDLHARVPTVRIVDTKNGAEAIQELPPDVAGRFRAYIAGKPPAERLWPGLWYERAAQMLRVDLAAVGIPYKDGSGAECGFHSLRAQYATDLVEGGVSLRTVQELMRVSDLKLVQRYSKVGLRDRVGALDRLAERRGSGSGAAAAAEGS